MKFFKFVSLLVLVLALALIGTYVVEAESSSQAEAVLADDYWFDPTTTFVKNEDLLRVTTESPSGTVTAVTIVQFDLSGVGFTIDKARLNLAVGYTGPCSVPAVDVNIYSTTDDTSEPLTRDALLMNLDQVGANPIQLAVPWPGPNSVSEAYQHWTDDNTIVGDTLADHVAAEQANDNTVTFWVEMASPNISSAFIQSEEQTVLEAQCGTGAGGSYTLGPPTLQVSDAAQPLAVSNLDASASNSSGVSPVVWIVLVAVVVVFSGIALVGRRRAEVG